MSVADAAVAQFGEPAGASGDELRFKCPYHDDSEGKLYVNTTSGLWLCFGGSCGRRGKVGNATVDDELLALRQRHKQLVEDNGTEVVQKLPESYLSQFQEHPYWTVKRRFTARTVKRFGLGYDVIRDRYTIPVRATDQTLLGIIYRATGDEKPKYLHPKGFKTGRHLFGAHLVDGRHRVALVEGPLDAIACWDARVPALACYGARLTEQQVWLLKYLDIQTVVPFFDNDTAGRYATKAAVELLPQEGIIVRHSRYRVGWTAKDPGELSPDQRRMYWNGAQ